MDDQTIGQILFCISSHNSEKFRYIFFLVNILDLQGWHTEKFVCKIWNTLKTLLVTKRLSGGEISCFVIHNKTSPSKSQTRLPRSLMNLKNAIKSNESRMR
ncbi:hypothetical protein EG68_09324 [Paragonimus skrjabini miyazakii]|uniref:Uncharacterized protein n=1 Tax=Paragonimus skrjabini miyazakii TaxID=59628 RepID=A0A8S9YMR8_9TREM|nr:hypothetical protein EG68_09324 [Paragonimus skrjabini miyazakii]